MQTQTISVPVTIDRVTADAVTCHVASGRSESIDWPGLRCAATANPDAALGAAYRAILDAAEAKAIEVAAAQARQRVSRCAGHVAERSETYGWTRCVARNRACNGAAHGAVVNVGTCRCGAVRQTETNGRHREEGSWLAPKIAAIGAALEELRRGAGR